MSNEPQDNIPEHAKIVLDQLKSARERFERTKSSLTQAVTNAEICHANIVKLVDELNMAYEEYDQSLERAHKLLNDELKRDEETLVKWEEANERLRKAVEQTERLLKK